MMQARVLKVIGLGLFVLIYMTGCGGKSATARSVRPKPAGAEAGAASREAFPDSTTANKPVPSEEDLDYSLKKLEDEKYKDLGDKGKMAEMFYERGQKFYQELKFAEANEALSRALEINPEHEKAKALLEDVRFARGDYTHGEMGSTSRRLFSEILAKTQQARLEVENRLNKGIKAFEQENYPQAEGEFKWVIETIKWFPYKAELSSYQQQADDYLKKTVERKTRKEQEIARRQEEAARLLAENEERRRKEEFIKTVDMLFRKAQAEFEKEQYEDAARLCSKILEKDPANATAEKLKTIALSAKRAKDRSRTTETLGEEWKKIFESYDNKTIPETSVITFPGKETWEKIDHRGPKKIFKEKIVSELDKQSASLLERKITFPFKEPTPLEDIIQFIRQTISGINILIDTTVITDPKETFQYNVVGIPLGWALKDMLSLKKWGYFIRDGVVIITSEEKVLEQQLETRWYDILDLTVPIVDFPAPEISLVPLPAEEGASDSVQIPKIKGDELMKLIQDTTAKNEGSWEAPRSIIFQETTGVLVVNHIPAVHAQIENLLREIRAETDIVVTIEARFVTVQQHFLEDIGINFSDLNGVPALPAAFSLAPPDAPGFSSLGSGIYGRYQGGRNELRARIENSLSSSDPYAKFISEGEPSPTGGSLLAYTMLDQTSFRLLLRAIQKNERATIINAPLLTVANGQRAHIQMSDQFTYVKDFDIVLVNASSSQVMPDPIVGTAAQGTILDVRPIVSADLKYISMELRPSSSSFIDQLPNVRTLRMSLLTLPPSAAFIIPTVDVELPELFLQRARGNAIIPDGGTLLMACYATGRNVDMNSNVPILSRLPFLGFLFRQKSIAYAKHVLLILVKGKISIMNEEEKRI
ncbi:MAG: hypothetical protein WC980_08995 [Candidatus Brocadiia bacterium]